MTTNVTAIKKGYPANRKAPVKLSADEKYMVYKYAVENHCLAQEGDLYKFRVAPERVAHEVNLVIKALNGRQINGYHVKDAVETVVDWQGRLNKVPAVPIETAELEQLKIFKIKATREIEELKLACEEKENALLMLRAELERQNKSSDALKYKKIVAFIQSL